MRQLRPRQGIHRKHFPQERFSALSGFELLKINWASSKSFGLIGHFGKSNYNPRQTQSASPLEAFSKMGLRAVPATPFAPASSSNSNQSARFPVVHIDRIYTRSGDHGETGLGDGQRVSKLHPRIVAGGSVDETNCAIGTAIAAGACEELTLVLKSLQQFLFDLGADLCVPKPADGPDPLPARIGESHVQLLEAMIDRFTTRLEPLRSFILPGGSPTAAALHLARAICRRAELDVLRLQSADAVSSSLLIALNRLSDLLFVLARIANNDGRTDILWNPGIGLSTTLAADAVTP